MNASPDETLFKSEPFDFDALIAAIRSKAAFCEQIAFFKENGLLGPEGQKRREKLAKYLEGLLQMRGIDGTFSLFGSSVSTLGFKDSDVDLFFDLPDYSVEPEASPRPRLYRKMEELQAYLSMDMKMDIPPPVRARVPILNLDFQQKFRPYGLRSDMTLLSRNGPVQARLLKHLCEMEPLFRDLALVTKLWMRAAGFIGKESLNSFAAVLMVLFYLQQKGLLPAIRALQETPSSSVSTSCEFQTESASFVLSSQKPKLVALFLDFFEFFHEFDFDKYIVSPNYGLEMLKSAFSHTIKQHPDSTSPIVIQDVFDLSRNQAYSMSGTFVSRFDKLFSDIATVVKDLREEYDGDEDKVASDVLSRLLDDYY